MAAPDEAPAPAGTPRAPTRTSTADFVVAGRITPDDIPALCERARALMDGDGVRTVVCDVRGLTHADGLTVEALARLQLAAQRRGCRIVLRNASIDLLGLLSLTGLTRVVPLEPDPDPRPP